MRSQHLTHIRSDHYAEEDKYIVEVEWKGEQLWTTKKKKNDKSK